MPGGGGNDPGGGSAKSGGGTFKRGGRGTDNGTEMMLVTDATGCCGGGGLQQNDNVDTQPTHTHTIICFVPHQTSAAVVLPLSITIDNLH